MIPGHKIKWQAPSGIGEGVIVHVGPVAAGLVLVGEVSIPGQVGSPAYEWVPEAAVMEVAA